jgi:hypothetical protein
MTPQDYLSERDRLREGAAQRRCEAWCARPERVLGMALEPITPARYSVLAGTENAFVCGGMPTLAQLNNFVWFCSPQFDPDKPLDSRSRAPGVLAELRRRLIPRWTWRNRDVVALANFRQAIDDVRAIMDSTFADAMPARETPGERPLAAAMEAQFLDRFANEYRFWPLDTPIRHTPLKMLFQLARCIDRRNAGEKDIYTDRSELSLDERFLRSLNPQADGQ